MLIATPWSLGAPVNASEVNWDEDLRRSEAPHGVLWCPEP